MATLKRSMWTMRSVSRGPATVAAVSIQVNSVSESVIIQGQSSMTVNVEGSGFTASTAWNYSGTGITINSVTFVDSGSVTLSVSASGSATVSNRSLTATIGATSAMLPNALDVQAQVAFSSIDITEFEVDSTESVTISGSGFAGTLVVTAGSGVTVSNVVIVDGSTITADFQVAAGASLGNRTITIARGSNQAVATDAIEIVDTSEISITSVFPTTVYANNLATQLSVSGVAFLSGTTVAVSGTGVTPGTPTIVSSTSLTVDVTAQSDATLGNRDLTLTSPNGSDDILVAAFAVVALGVAEITTPVVQKIPPTIVSNGASVDIQIDLEYGEYGGTWTVTGLPAWASWNPTTRKITGTASTGFTRVDIHYSNASGSNRIDHAIRVYSATTTIDSAWLAANGGANGPWTLSNTSTRYQLGTSPQARGTAFIFGAAGVLLDLNGYDIDYNTRTHPTITDPSFEDTSTNWDFASAPSCIQDTTGTVRTAFLGISGQTKSIKFAATGASLPTETVVGNTPVTLEASTTYRLAAFFYFSDQNNPNSVGFRVRLRKGATTFSVFYNSQFYRGMQYVSGSFTTGIGDAGDYDVEVEITNLNVASGSAYVDHVLIGFENKYGVDMINQSNGIVYDSSGSKAAISEACPLLAGYRNYAVNGGGNNAMQLYNIRLETQSVNGHVYKDNGGGYSTIMGCEIAANATATYDRDNHTGYAILSEQFRLHVDSCTIEKSCQGGVYFQSNAIQISRNVIAFQSRYTNGFAIDSSGVTATVLDIRKNTINLHSGDNSGRGIHVIGTGAAPKFVRNNIINAREIARNVEYGGSVTGGCYGIQPEDNISNLSIHNNIVNVYADDCDAVCLRISSPGSSCDVSGNLFTARKTGGSARAGILSLVEPLGAGWTFENNQYDTNYHWFINCRTNTTDFELNGHWIWTDDGYSSAVPYHGDDAWYSGGFQFSGDITVTGTHEDTATRDRLDDDTTWKTAAGVAKPTPRGTITISTT